jgi:sugar phosphate permease
MTSRRAAERAQDQDLVRRFPFYYGWIILAVGTLGMILTSPGQTYVVSIFIERFIADLGLSRSLVSTLYTIGTLTGSLTLTFWGHQIDRRGPRVMMGVIAGLLGLACIYMGSVQNAVMLGAGFVLIRMLGQGALGMVSLNVINQWWVRRRGTVVGLSGVVSAVLGMGLFPNLVNALVGGLGWRATYPILGVSQLLLTLPLALVFVRRRPEAYGLRPDGDLPAVGAGGSATPAEVNWTLREALRTPAFWVIALGVASVAMFGTGLYFHLVSIFADNGLSQDIAAAVYVPISLTMALTRLGGGFLTDRVPVRVLMAVALLLMTLALVLTPLVGSFEMALVYGVVMGIKGGLTQLVSSVVWADYFGRRHLGSIAGAASTIGSAGSALGPLPLGVARDLLGSYTLALLICAVVPLVLGAASLFVRAPQREAADA